MELHGFIKIAISLFDQKKIQTFPARFSIITALIMLKLASERSNEIKRMILNIRIKQTGQNVERTGFVPTRPVIDPTK